MKKKISSLLIALVAFGALQLAAPASAAACADPNCPWSPVTVFVKNVIYRAGQACDRYVGEVVDPNPCP